MNERRNLTVVSTREEELTADELREQVRASLLAFVDFLYAVVFGLVLAGTYERIILSEELSVLNRAGNTILVLGVFYFLTWDWIHGRLLTLKNPYTGYRRFFVEVVIAFCGYGAALGAVRGRISFMIGIILILMLGAYWARRTSREYPESPDIWELWIIQRYQARHAVLVSIVTIAWYYVFGSTITFVESISFVAFGWVFVLVYEVIVERTSGIERGPGVPFISRRQLKAVKSFINKHLKPN
ncbi:hypothetical protein A3I40_03070 [Candidatus Uhrbacteria bacterium RIFCSPLOWO2_02_FULL_48_12]|uniref:DUF1211 domain-containing protein n=1 Tax=Candidatus Uhrbacteria bacterium RIFCSPLOWO2_02_FULL_48_12 TaxID=1802407 RepID=A0A1F7V700_9BACT|nr:MAG: hypothetical protein A3I40_03070 [Candidatus Uhrbacteria bacterium RIFCSPLOWO2_02_FULL_48_12]